MNHPSLCLITLGCPKNVVEGEQLAGLFAAKGIALTTDLARATYAVVHTCSFIADARGESEETVRKLIALKRGGALEKIFVTGCLVQGDGPALARRFPEVDGFVGTGELGRIGELLSPGRRILCGTPGGLLESDAPRLLSSALPSAYVRIAEGCNHRCSFCIIPSLRGRYRSRTVASVVEETEELAALGVEEIVLVAQDTSQYGRDLYGRHALPALITKLAAVKGIRWIRLLYAYPNSVTPELIDVMRGEEKICRYLDVPLQHASDRVLERMGRPKGARKFIERLTGSFPGLAVRTSFVVGFPGETGRDFGELLDLVREGHFEHVGVFEYSAVPGARSYGWKRGVSDPVRRGRKEQVMLEQRKIVAARHRGRIGAVEEVLTERVVRAAPGKRRLFAGRTRLQAPEIDGCVIFGGNAKVGSFARVRITGARGYDLAGESLP